MKKLEGEIKGRFLLWKKLHRARVPDQLSTSAVLFVGSGMRCTLEICIAKTPVIVERQMKWVGMS